LSGRAALLTGAAVSVADQARIALRPCAAGLIVGAASDAIAATAQETRIALASTAGLIAVATRDTVAASADRARCAGIPRAADVAGVAAGAARIIEANVGPAALGCGRAAGLTRTAAVTDRSHADSTRAAAKNRVVIARTGVA